MSTTPNIKLILSEGESFKVEFKANNTNIDREIVAFANAAGGSIYLGVDDQCQIVGINITNRLKSEIQDIARNCDPSIKIKLIPHNEYRILEIQVDEGGDKPYRCTNGFYLRVGACAQKLRRDEIVQLINDSGKIRFDETLNTNFNFEEDFSKEKFQKYLDISNIKSNASVEDILQSLNVVIHKNHKINITNGGVLFFAKNPQRFFPESYVTCVRYQFHDRFSIIDKAEITGSLIDQIEQTMLFILRNIAVKTVISTTFKPRIGQSTEIYDYPVDALREAVINAVTHRDYNYDSSHIYVHIYPDRIDIENPGGLFHGLTRDKLGKLSIRRNRLIADLLFRAKYIERAGTGFDRMVHALSDNKNPPLDVTITNFFTIRFYKRVEEESELDLTRRQQLLYGMIKERHFVKKHEVALFLNISDDTALRELNYLMKKQLIRRSGTGKSIIYDIIK